MHKNNYDLIFFDCDGVLVDSERTTNSVFSEMLNELGIPVTLDDMFERFVGHTMPQCTAIVAELLGRKAPHDFVDNYRIRTRAALESQLVAAPGIEAALGKIALPWCVASSGDHEKMRTTLGITGLLPHFEGKLFSVTEVENPKPAPDVFLHAAARNNVPPARCIVIEDTPTGVAAGLAAGMTAYGYSALTPAHRLQAAGAHLVFDDMAELPNLIINTSAGGIVT